MSHHRKARVVLALRSVPRIGPAAIKKNLAAIAAAAQQEDVFGTMGSFLANRTSRESFSAFMDEADRVIEHCERIGIQALTILDPDYPERLSHLSTPPPVLFCRGDMTRLSQKTIGVIGSRKPSRMGAIIAGRIGSYFAESSSSICNGLADGIDAFSVQADGRYHKGVVGVIASGLNLFEEKISSRTIVERASHILSNNGLLVSEAAPGGVENTYSTIASCRIQAGISDALVLVQSKIDGGSRFTVAAFCELPRVLAFVVPPEREQEEDAFEANRMILRDGSTGLANFAQAKSSARVAILPIRSRDDYVTILRDTDVPRLSLHK